MRKSIDKKQMICAAIAALLAAGSMSGCTGREVLQTVEAADSATSSNAETPGQTEGNEEKSSSQNQGSGISGAAASLLTEEYEGDEAIDWTSEEYTKLDLNQGSASVTKSGIYVVSGTLADGSITVDVNKDTDNGTVYLVFNGVTIHSESTAPVYIKEAEKVVMQLEEGTENIITQGSAISADESGDPDSAIFSKADLTITGNGTLHVTSAFHDGITSKDDLKMTGGIITVTAVDDGMTGKDLVAATQVSLTIEAGKDGIRTTNTEEGKGNVILSDGTYIITAGNDGIQAEQQLQIEGGSYQITSGGGYPGQSTSSGNDDRGVMPVISDSQTDSSDQEESKKGIKAGTSLLVTGGTFTISSYDDALHSNGVVFISGGIWNVETGDDGIHAEGTLTIENGEITVSNSNEGLEGSDITINGGTISVVSKDDGINVSSSTGILAFGGGGVTVSSGGDGLDSNGSLTQTGGSVVINTESTGAGDTPVDVDGTITISGGTLTDHNGTAIDYSSQQGHGGGRGNKMAPGGGQMPDRNAPDGETPADQPPSKGTRGGGTNGDQNLQTS